MQLLKEMEEDFNLFYNNPELYREKVNGISDLLGLKDKSKLRDDFLPTYYVGNKNIKNPYILFSINPGFDLNQNTKEEQLKSGTFENYQNFIENFYTLFFNSGFRSRYYSIISHLFCGVENIDFSNKKEYYEFYAKNLLNVDLIPYHSTSFRMNHKSTEERKSYLKTRFESVLEFIGSLNSKLVIFNGAEHFKLLRDYGYLNGLNSETLNDKSKVRLYVFEIKGIPCILFTQMISGRFSNLKSTDLRDKLPQIIRSFNNSPLLATKVSYTPQPTNFPHSEKQENLDNDIYNVFRTFVLSLSPHIKEIPRKKYTSYTKNDETFLCLELASGKLLIFLRLKDEKVEKYGYIGEDVRGKIHCGKRNFRITINYNGLYDLDLIQEVIRDSFSDI